MHPLKIARIGFLVGYCALVYSCDSPTQLSEANLIEFVNESSELTKTISSGDYKIQVSFKPTDLLVAQELRSMTNRKTIEIKEARNKYSGHYYFIVSLSNKGKEVLNASTLGNTAHSELLSTISFKMSEVVSLLTSSGDTVYVADYVHQRTFGTATSTDILFVFDKSNSIRLG